MPKRREAKLDLCGDNNIGDLKCLVGMIWLNHLITYITTAACSAVCQWCARTCVCFQSSPLCISICACLCSGKQALKSYDWPRSVCLNTWWLKRFMSTKGPTWDSFFFLRAEWQRCIHTLSTQIPLFQSVIMNKTSPYWIPNLTQFEKYCSITVSGKRSSPMAGIETILLGSLRWRFHPDVFPSVCSGCGCVQVLAARWK